MALSTDRGRSASSGDRDNRARGADLQAAARSDLADETPVASALPPAAGNPRQAAPTPDLFTRQRRPAVVPPPPWEPLARPSPVPPPLPIDSPASLATARPPPAPASRGARRGRRGMVLLVLALLVLGGALYYLLKSPASGSTSAKTRPAIGALFTNRLGKGLGDWLGKWRSPPLAATNSAPAPARGSSLAASVRQTRKVVREVLAIRQSAEETDSGADNDKRTADVRKLPASTDHVSSPQDAALASAVGAGKTEAIVWPEIEITALVGSGSRGSALINGDFLTVGEANDADVTLVEIEPQAALLEFKGQRRRIPVKKR